MHRNSGSGNEGGNISSRVRKIIVIPCRHEKKVDIGSGKEFHCDWNMGYLEGM